jgi:hypothetical protein
VALPIFFAAPVTMATFPLLLLILRNPHNY